MLKKITKLIEERKKELNSLLKRGRLNKEVEYQIKGAINEINVILRILNDHRYTEIEKELDSFKLIKLENDDNSFLSKIFGKKSLTNGKSNTEKMGQEAH